VSDLMVPTTPSARAVGRLLHATLGLEPGALGVRMKNRGFDTTLPRKRDDAARRAVLPADVLGPLCEDNALDLDLYAWAAGRLASTLAPLLDGPEDAAQALEAPVAALRSQYPCVVSRV